MEVKKRKSFRFQINVVVSASIMLLIALINIQYFYMTRQLFEESMTYFEYQLYTQQEKIDAQLKLVDNMLSDIMLNSSAFRRYSESDTNLYQNAALVKQDFMKVTDAFPIVNLAFVTHEEDEDVHAQVYNSLKSKQGVEVSDYLRQMRKNLSEIQGNSWAVEKIGEDSYLIRVIRYKKACIGAIIWLQDPAQLLTELSTIHNADWIWILSEEQREEILEGKGCYGYVGQKLPFYLFFMNKRILLQQQSEMVPVALGCLVEMKDILGTMRTMQGLIGFLCIGLFALIPFLVWFLYKKLNLPMDQLQLAMKTIKKNEWDYQLPESEISEVQDVYSTFEEMMQEIQNLKIKSYEEQLEMIDNKLQYFQLQLKPHFYLNSLKGIYGMAEKKDYEKIQEMVKYLSDFFRYLVYQNESKVKLWEELQHVKNYIAIQEIGHVFHIQCDLQIDGGLMNVRIPVLAIQTFIENSVKYAGVTEGILRCTIEVVAIGTNEKYIKLLIKDNGVGYPKQIIYDINNRKSVEEHVGLSNLNSRLQLLYQEKAYILLSNEVTGGARAEILFPYEI